MSKFKPLKEGQMFLLPPSIDDFVPESHLARVIKEIVYRLDTTKIEEKYSDQGQKSFHPKIIISLLIYGYAIGIKSGRKIAKKCEEDVAFMYLSSMYKPDFRTINDFRKDNLEMFTKYFVLVLKICKEMEVAQVGTITIDEMKQSTNGREAKELNENWSLKLKEQVQALLKQAKEQDAEDDDKFGEKRGDELPEGIRQKQSLILKIESTMKGLEKEKTNHKK